MEITKDESPAADPPRPLDVPAPEAPASDPSPPADSDGLDGFEAALREFDQSAEKRPATQLALDGVVTKSTDAPAPQPEQKPDNTATELAELRQWAEGVQAERESQREQDDIALVIEKAQEHLEGYDILPPDFAERFLTSEYVINPELNAAWRDRYSSEAAMRRCQHAVRGAFTRLREAARKVPDPVATEDREAVAAAVRGRSGPAPLGTPPNYGRMTDGEFQAEKERLGIE